MTGLVALCADATSLQHPEALGLSGECLTAQEWLRVFTSAEEARRYLRTDRAVDEVWVASNDEVEPINLAATLKRDRADRCVCLLTFEATGSLWSRANAAGIDASLTRQAFVARYGQRKWLATAEMAARAQRSTARSSDVEQRDRALASLANAAAQPRAAAVAASAERPAPPRGSTAFFLPIVGGGGGVGKSTVAVLCALAAQRRGLKTLLIDFDLQFGDMPRLLGVEDPLTMDELLASPERAERLAPDGKSPALLAAPKRLELAESVSEQAATLLGGLVGSFDVIIANTGASWAEQHAVLLERCSKALFLVDQRPSSLEACRRALDLCSRCGIASSPFSYAVNRCSKRSLFSAVDVASALQVQQVFELAEGGRDVEELLGAGMALELLESRNPLSASVVAMTDELLPESAATDARGESRGARAGLFGRRAHSGGRGGRP